MTHNDSAADYTGKWHCKYWFPSNQHVGKDVSEYDVTIQPSGNNLVLESLPNEDKSYMFARMALDNRVVTGNWHENTSPSGEFKGAIYIGVFMLIIDPSDDRMEGKWIGNGQDNGVLKIYTGRWELTRID